MSPITIILADSQYLIRHGLKYVLNDHQEYKVVGEPRNRQQLLKQVAQLRPQVIILDHQQHPGFIDGLFSSIKKIAPATHVLIISADNSKENIYELLEIGINSFLTKECDKEEILNAINATAKGEKFFCNKVLNYLLEKSFTPSTQRPQSDVLTDRQKEIIRLISKGKIAREIAQELHLSTHTVYTHRKNIMKKLQLTNSSELMVYAMNHGLLS